MFRDETAINIDKTGCTLPLVPKTLAALLALPVLINIIVYVAYKTFSYVKGVLQQCIIYCWFLQ